MRLKQDNPRKYQKKYRNYTSESLQEAYKAVKEKRLSVNRAALSYGVPAQTLRDRVNGNVDPNNFIKGKEPTFTKEEELSLVEGIETMAELGYGFSHKNLQHTAGELAHNLGRKASVKSLSNNWMYGFLKRWNTRLASMKPRKVDSNRARSTTPEKVKEYFDNLKAVFDKYDLHTKPQNIYNLDETGLQPDHRPSNIIANIHSKPQAITSPRSTTTTLIACTNAIGNCLPPYFIFKGKRCNDELMKGASPGTGYQMSETGWSNGEIFMKYLKNHFVPFVKGQTQGDDHVLLIFDGHTSHCNPTLISWAKEQNIILLILPAHTSHLLEPLDVCMFGPFKSFYYSECGMYMNKNIGKNITKYDICHIACKAYMKAMSPMNIVSGFRKTGIYPLAPGEIQADKLYTCESFREDHPVEKVTAMKSGKEAIDSFLKEKYQKIEEEKKKTCCDCTCKSKKGSDQEIIKRPNPSGRAVTEDSYLIEITEYDNEKNLKKSKKDASTHNKRRSEKTQKIQPDITVGPSTSGVEMRNSHHSEDVESDDEMEMDESELCCVCKSFTSPKLKDLPYLKIVNWGQCDKCGHWVHLALCTNVHVVRRHSHFLCPCCE